MTIDDTKIILDIKIEFVDGPHITILDAKDYGFEENGNLFWIAYDTPDEKTRCVDYIPTAHICRIQNIFRKYKEE